MTWLHDILLVVGSIGGALAGGWLTRATMNRQWRLDHRIEAYSDVLGLSRVIFNEVTRSYFGLDDIPKIHLLERHTELSIALNKALLLSPYPDIRTSCMAMNSSFSIILTKSQISDKMPEEEWKKLTNKAAEATRDFMTAAMRHLHSSSGGWQKL